MTKAASGCDRVGASPAPRDIPLDELRLIGKLLAVRERPIRIDQCWSETEQVAIVGMLAKLGLTLHKLSTGLRKAHAEDNLQAFQAGITLSLKAIYDALEPVMGPHVLYGLEQGVHAYGGAWKGKRHWSIALPDDKPHVPQSAPDRDMRKVIAAALLDYFGDRDRCKELGLSQEGVAAAISSAMSDAGFVVKVSKSDAELNYRTVQNWRSRYLPGKRHRQKEPPAAHKEAFREFVELLAKGRKDQSLRDYFVQELAALADNCRYHHELFHPLA